MNKEKVQALLIQCQHNFESIKDDQISYQYGICKLLLGDFTGAKELFKRSIHAMLFSPPLLWKMTLQPESLVHIWILSGEEYLYPVVKNQIDDFSSSQMGTSLYTIYAASLLDVLSLSKCDQMQAIEKLIANPKKKEIYALGKCLQKIVNGDNQRFNEALENLLLIHKRSAQQGGLRDSVEGLVCLSAMSLGYAALKYNFSLRADSEFFKESYLHFLMS